MGNKRFKNLYQKRIKRSFYNYLLWALGFYPEKERGKAMPPSFCYPNPKEAPSLEYKATWVNHSTYIIEAKGITFITDPIFKKRCSPVKGIGPKRNHDPEPSLKQLPKIDIVLISHNHYDHMERSSLQFLYKANPQTLWIVPVGVKQWFKRRMKEVPQEKIVELGWYESQKIVDARVLCTAVPAQHFSGRGLFDHNQTLWMGVVVEVEDKRFYFAGDTGYNEVDFKEIGNRFGKMDLSLLPVGVYSPRDFMRGVHINPEEAVQIHQEVGSTLSIGGHWKTFKLSSEGLARPPFDLYCALEEKGVSKSAFRILDPGQTIGW